MTKPKRTDHPAGIRAHLPAVVRLSIVRTGRKTRFIYEEDFSSRKLCERSVAALAERAPMPGITVEVVKPRKGRLRLPGAPRASRQMTTVRLSGLVDRAVIGAMMASEFMAWSRFGECSLRQLMLFSVATHRP